MNHELRWASVLTTIIVVLAGVAGAQPARAASGFVDVPPGTAFEAEIPAFTLSIPRVLH